VRVKFTTLIPLLNINLSEITNPSNLYIILRPNEMNALQSPIRYNTCTSPALRAPSHLILLRIAYSAYGGWGPETEVVCVVHPDCLAHGGLRGFGTAGVCAGLAAFGFGREFVVHVSGIPDLVVIVLLRTARPDLDLVPVGHTAACQINTSAFGPFDMVVTEFRVAEFLVRIFRRAIPHLEFSAVRVLPAGNVQAFSTVIEGDGTVRSKLPLLVRAAFTIGHYDWCAVLVVGAEAFRVIRAGLDEEVTREGGVRVCRDVDSAEDSGD